MLKIALLTAALLAFPSSGHAMTVDEAPIGLLCTSVTFDRSELAASFPKGEVRPEDVEYSNRCIHDVQAYVKAHCPKSKKTIWQQIEAVAFSGPGIPDERALKAACR